jgi:hypothetical protein
MRDKVTNAGMKHLAGLTELSELSLANTHVSDSGLKELAPLKNLCMLFVSNNLVTDASIAYLRRALPKSQISRVSQPIPGSTQKGGRGGFPGESNKGGRQ